MFFPKQMYERSSEIAGALKNFQSGNTSHSNCLSFKFAFIRKLNHKSKIRDSLTRSIVVFDPHCLRRKSDVSCRAPYLTSCVSSSLNVVARESLAQRSSFRSIVYVLLEVQDDHRRKNPTAHSPKQKKAVQIPQTVINRCYNAKDRMANQNQGIGDKLK